MILDNKNNHKKVHEWLREFTDTGKMDIVTGYFTIGAIAQLARQSNEKVSAFRMVLGEIVSIDKVQDKSIDLLNENITMEAALGLTSVAQEAVAFLKQDKVLAKTLEPNFCHAKLYLFHHTKDDRYKYFISGSSNLTEAGLGLKTTNNVELNIAETGDNNQYRELTAWFDQLWQSREAHQEKTIVHEDGAKTTKPFKEYLIEAIQKIFAQYTPQELYYKVLFELFGNQEYHDPVLARQIGRLENTLIYNALYDFQRKGVLSLIKMLQKYDGAILADAVGLGKTWSALAVMKFFQSQGREIILICPKKLEYNWRRYLRHQNSRFERDQLEYFIRFHTDMHEARMESYKDRADTFFISEKPKLFVIDESHNLRNDKSQRYRFLVSEILQKNADAKVLMLSATPINNTLLDIRNQCKLIKQGRSDGFSESHSIKNVDYLFKLAQTSFFKWREMESPKIHDFIKLLPPDFFRLTDSLTVARTRSMIENKKEKGDLSFPKKNKPKNIFVTPRKIGNYDSFEELFDRFPPLLSAYQPAFYIEQAKDVKKIEDEQQRDRFLVKMMYILLVKRLESSWPAFHSTLEKILAHHQNALNKVHEYAEGKKKTQLDHGTQAELFDDEEDLFSLGEKRPIRLSEIEKAGHLHNFKKDLNKDIESLDALKANLDRFRKEIEAETRQPGNSKSKDEKLQSLIEEIRKKRSSAKNKNNQKLLVFTVYKDSAFYLFDQLVKRGFRDIAVVSGEGSKTDRQEHKTKSYEPILERFAPFTKLFNEKEWDFRLEDHLTKEQQYEEWKQWLKDHDPTTYQKLQSPIDILIATDVLSEGQNLQDCDMVINYDIHWNPVRVIQRMGRIDRLASPNDEIFGINYWPSDNINSYLDLKGRIEKRMTLMKLAGSEVQLEFSREFQEMAQNAAFEDKMNEKMLRQMQTSWEDIEESEGGLGFDKLSLEDFRRELQEELQQRGNFYTSMPKGIYTGFQADSASSGMIALLGFPAKKPKVLDHAYDFHHLIYIDRQGRQIVSNEKEILDMLALHKDKPRFVPDALDRSDKKAVLEWSSALRQWLAGCAKEEVKEDGAAKTYAGTKTKDLLNKIKIGDSHALKQVKKGLSPSEAYKPENCDLLAWFFVS